MRGTIRFVDENNCLHCDDGPALAIDEYESWWVRGKRHRIGGPAVVNYYLEEWYVNGVDITKTLLNG